jgi:hypothetical protein
MWKLNTAPRNLRWVVLAALVATCAALTANAWQAEESSAEAQTSWTQLPAIDSYASPAIASLGHLQQPLSHFVGRVYVASTAFTGHMYYTSTDSPGGWDAWQSVGPEHCTSFPCVDPYHFDPYTAPVLVRHEDRIYLLARGTDDNLYETHRGETGDWSAWQGLTSDARVSGRLSVALTGSGGTLNTHVMYDSVGNTVEYRRFNSGWAQAGPIEKWNNAVEGTIGTDGENEVWAVIRTNIRRLVIERKNSPWSVPWQSVRTDLAEGTLGDFFDISDIVFFGGDYHFAYAEKWLCDDVSSTYCHSLHHVRYRPPNGGAGYVEEIRQYTPVGDNHPRSQLIVYRNKLVVTYKDEQGWVRTAYWDNADPWVPWVGDHVVAGGRTSHRPAAALLNQCLDLRSAECIESGFGNDILAAVNAYSTDRLWFINLSRAYFVERLPDLDLEVRWCTPGMVKCPTLTDPPAITELPVYTEVGYATMVLPDWLMSRYFWRVQQAAGVTDLYYTWVHTQDVGAPWVGPNINIDRKMNYLRWWEEGAHTLAGALGFCDDGFCETPGSPGTNLMWDYIPNSVVNTAFTLFAEAVNGARTCDNGTGSDGVRCRGFTGFGNNYDVGTRQHSFMYPLQYFHSKGAVLRQFVQDDLANSVDLLERKYDWHEEYIFHGVEFNSDSEPLVPLGNDQFAAAPGISSLPFSWTQDTAEATSETGEPNPSCAAISNSVWYRYTPDVTQEVKVHTFDSDYDTQLAVWRGPSLGSLTEVGCDDDTGGTLQSEVQFAASAGQTYYFQVDGFGAASGTLVLTLKLQNDDFAQAFAISGPRFTRTQTTAGASIETSDIGEPQPSCTSSVDDTVWYKYIPSITQDLRADTFGSGYDTELVVWRGPSLGSLTEVGCNDDSGGNLLLPGRRLQRSQRHPQAQPQTGQ